MKTAKIRVKMRFFGNVGNPHNPKVARSNRAPATKYTTRVGWYLRPVLSPAFVVFFGHIVPVCNPTLQIFPLIEGNSWAESLW
jgi:hypothetical protein